MKKQIYALCVTLGLLIGSLDVFSIVIDSSTVNAEVGNSEDKNLVELVENNPDLSTFVQLMNAAEFAANLEGTGPYTLFAPSNEAFAELPQGTVQDLLKKENKTKLTNLLKNHIVSGKLLTSSMNTSNVNSMGGKPLHITVRGSQVSINDAIILQPDLVGSNGVVQIIDKVILNK